MQSTRPWTGDTAGAETVRASKGSDSESDEEAVSEFRSSFSIVCTVFISWRSRCIISFSWIAIASINIGIVCIFSVQLCIRS